MKRKLLAECAGARSGTSAATDRADAVASRRGDRYVWARLQSEDAAERWELTLWEDGRVTLDRSDPTAGTVRLFERDASERYA